MGQSWMLVNLRYYCVAGGGCKLGEIFCSEGLHIHIRHFTRPAWSEQSRAELCLKYPRVAHRSASPQSKLLRLADELLLMIFRYIDSLADAICLSLADGRLFAIGFSTVVKLQSSAYANWAGANVVCLGDYACDDDLPAAIIKKAKACMKRWPQAMEDPEDDPEDDPDGKFLYAVKNHFFEFKRGMDTAGHFRTAAELRDLGQDKDAFKEMMKPRYDSSHPWVLCNLSKGEYIRADAVAKLTNSKGDTPFIANAIRLDHALLSRVCWSSDGSIAMVNEDNLHRGSWAGDRFEVTSMDKIDPRIDWKDVSKETVKTLQKIWRNDYGKDWKKQLLAGKISWWTPGATYH
ncbi:hypothetical protein BC629DRAFT_1434177 [Irpex lacteus]|nr:hypothetical protein BC629DRAFT_1434177 [Irpex lacteus]